MEKQTLKNFFRNGGCICALETEERASMLGEQFDKDALTCQYRQNGLQFLDDNCRDLIFGECTHPDKRLRKTTFCSPLKAKLDREYPY